MDHILDIITGPITGWELQSLKLQVIFCRHKPFLKESVAQMGWIR